MDGLHGILCSGSHKIKIKASAGLLPGGLESEPTSTLIWVVDRVYFLVEVGLRAHFLAGCQLGACSLHGERSPAIF